MTLALYSTGHDSLFLPFRDATSGKETYGAGRYLDIDPNEDGTITLDMSWPPPDDNCVNCHGTHGLGNGPSAKSLNPPPPDLTRLSRDNEGKFPSARVIMAIDGRSRIPGHLNGQMPIWGLSLQEPGRDANQETEVRKKIERLVRFLESIQTGK